MPSPRRRRSLSSIRKIELPKRIACTLAGSRVGAIRCEMSAVRGADARGSSSADKDLDTSRDCSKGGVHEVTSVSGGVAGGPGGEWDGSPTFCFKETPGEDAWPGLALSPGRPVTRSDGFVPVGQE